MLDLSDIPFDVIVLESVALKVNVLVNVLFIEAPSVKEPEIVRAALPANVPANVLKSSERHPVFPAAIVIVFALEKLSINTSSADVGIASPPVPPEVNAHLLPAVPSQDAVPPTQ
jgi:hypothetical protein